MTEIELTIEEANDYHLSRGNAAWSALSDPQKLAAIQNAIDFVLFRYGPFKSTVETANERMKIAVSLMALSLHQNPQPLAADPKIKTKKVKSGQKEIETTYQDADKAPIADPYVMITAILAPLRVSSGTGASISFGRMVL